MPVSGIAANGLSNFSAENIQQELQQLGKDLQSGNLSAAQSDFVTLQNDLPQGSQASAPQSSDPIAQAFQQLGKDLQSGDLSAAQSDFVTLQQDLSQGSATLTPAGTALPSQIQNSTPLTPQIAGNGSIPSQGNSTSSSQSRIAQAFQQLGKDLQSGNLAAAQSDFATLQQDLSQSSQASLSQSINPVTQASTQSTQGAEGHHHHQSGESNGSSEANQLLAQLGQELQSGSLSSAQQTFNSLQQALQQVSQNSGQ
jgi:hypothetical protein